MIGQDPASHETVVRRILVGEAGQRVQGLLAKLGVDRSYVMINAFLYSVYGQGGGQRHKNNELIAAYRHRWIDKLAGPGLEAIVSLGGLADSAYQRWRQTPAGQMSTATYAAITHPTYPESASAAGQKTKAEATEALLANWNDALPALHAALTPGVSTPLVSYGESFSDADRAPIPERDLPPGLPEWMRSVDAWSSRRAIDEAEAPSATDDDRREAKRAGLGMRVPRKQRGWHAG